MRMLRLPVVLVCLGLLCSAGLLWAADKPKDLIVGKWAPDKGDNKITVEFTKDGAVKVIFPEGILTIEGKYKFTDDKTMEMELTSMGMTQKDKLEVAINKDEMTTTDSKGKVEKFKRIK